MTRQAIATLGIALLAIVAPAHARAQTQVPAEYATVLSTLGKGGDYKDNVLKVNIPRNDLKVAIDGRPAPTPFGFGGWVAFTKGTDGMDVMMGDLVLTDDEVNPVMSALLANGFDITALHNHFLGESPRIMFMHVHGHGRAADLATKLKPAIDLIGRSKGAAAPSPTPATTTEKASLDTAALAKIIGHEGEQNGPVYKITIGRSDVAIRDHGAVINTRMGLNTWAAFTGTDADAMVAGDVAMLDDEITPVLRALRDHGIDVVSIHQHMTTTSPMIFFLHYYATGPAQQLAEGVHAAFEQLGKGRAREVHAH
jgi:hypothetical protein